MTSTTPNGCTSARALHVVVHGTVVHVELAPSVPASGAAAIAADWSDAVAPAGAPCEVALTADLAPVPGGNVRGSGPGGDHGGDPGTVTAPTLEALRQAVAARVITLGAHLAGDGHLVVAAAAVATPDGRAGLLLGAPGAGKTTAAVALAQAGMTYLGDEMIAIRAADGMVLPLASPLLLRHEDGGSVGSRPGDDPGPRDLRSATSLGLASAAGGEFPLAAMLLLARDADGAAIERAASVEVEQVDLAEALVTVVGSVVGGTSATGFLRRVMALLDASGGLRRVRYRDAGRLVPLVASPPAPGGAGGTGEGRIEADSRPSVGVRAVRSRGGLRRTDVTDSLLVDGRPVIVHDGSVHVLDGLGALVWERAALGENPDAIAREAVRRFGIPPGGADAGVAVARAAEELVGLGLIRG